MSRTLVFLCIGRLNQSIFIDVPSFLYSLDNSDVSFPNKSENNGVCGQLSDDNNRWSNNRQIEHI